MHRVTTQGGLLAYNQMKFLLYYNEVKRYWQKQDPRHRNNGGASGSSGSEQPITVVNSFDPIDALGKALASTKGRKVLIKAAVKNVKH